MLTIVQVGRQPAMSSRKCSSTSWPCSVCSTSGCHCTPASRRSTSSKAATGVPAVEASTSKPGGRRDDRVAVAHPDRVLAGQVGEQRAGVGRPRPGCGRTRERPVRRPRRRGPGPSPGSRSTCRRPGPRPSKTAASSCGRARLVDRGRSAGQDDRLRARGPASRRPASCAARSRSRPGPRGPGGRSAGRTARRSRRRGPGRGRRAPTCREPIGASGGADRLRPCRSTTPMTWSSSSTSARSTPS